MRARGLVHRLLGTAMPLCLLSGLAWGDQATIATGHHLATLVCANCHRTGPDQIDEPVLDPPAPSFESIMQRSTTSRASLEAFLTRTHRDLRSPQGMPNPQLLDTQVRDVLDYLMSLKKSAPR
jgi:cytochrome c1